MHASSTIVESANEVAFIARNAAFIENEIQNKIDVLVHIIRYI